MSTNVTEMYLDSNGTKLKIPVLPEKLEWNDSSNHSSVDIGDIGEILLQKGRKAQTISFSSFFPDTTFQGSEKNIDSPKNYVKTIEKWINDKNIVKFVLIRSNSKHVGVSMNTLITSFKYSEEGGDVGTIQYSISFKEYRKVTVNTIKVNQTKKVTSNRTTTKKAAKTYTVKSGDCLWNIAKKQLGNATRWKEIYNLNKSVIENTAKKHGYKSSSTGHWIFPGTILVLPN